MNDLRDDPGGSPYHAELAHLLDAAVKRLRATRRTFTEDEALQPVWDAGHELSPQLDPRFAVAREADGRKQRHWRLRDQVLANERLLDALLTGAWDGHNTDVELDRLEAEDGVVYIFCPADPRFVVGNDGALAPSEEREREVPPATRAALDDLGAALLDAWSAAEPRTVRQITTVLGDLGWSGAEAREAWLLVRAWLQSWSSVTRVGADLWIPTDQLPSPSARSRLQVLPVARRTSDEPAQPDTTPPSTVADDETTPRSADLLATPLFLTTDTGSQHVRWTTTLRTVHLIEGFVPAPAAVRSAYSARAPGEGNTSVLRGLWFASGDRFWLWLDRTRDRLFGPALADQLAWCTAGDQLLVEWAPDVVVLRVTGNDADVQHEETRLVDVAALAELRGGRGESYRATIQVLLEGAHKGMTFQDLVAAVRERQGHAVHRDTIRAVLRAGGFIQRDGRWYAAPDAAQSGRSLRAAVVDTLAGGADEPGAEVSSTTARARRRPEAIRRRLAELIEVMEQDLS